MTDIPVIVNIEIALAIIIPLSGLVAATVRYFWKKSSCFTLMENKINELSQKELSSGIEHDGFEERIVHIEKKLIKYDVYFRLLLEDRNIPIPNDIDPI